MECAGQLSINVVRSHAQVIICALVILAAQALDADVPQAHARKIPSTIRSLRRSVAAANHKAISCGCTELILLVLGHMDAGAGRCAVLNHIVHDSFADLIQRLATGDVLLRVSVEVATQGGDFGHTLTFCGAGLFNLRLTLSFGFCFRFRAQGLDLSLKRVKLAGFFLGHVPACSAGGCEDCLLTLHLLLHQCSFVHAVPPVSGFYLP